MLAIYKKEMRSYFINPVGYVFLGVFLTIAAGLCTYTTLQSRSYDTASFFYMMILVMIIIIPLLTMRTFAEEHDLDLTEQIPYGVIIVGASEDGKTIIGTANTENGWVSCVICLDGIAE